MCVPTGGRRFYLYVAQKGMENPFLAAETSSRRRQKGPSE